MHDRAVDGTTPMNARLAVVMYWVQLNMGADEAYGGSLM